MKTVFRKWGLALALGGAVWAGAVQTADVSKVLNIYN